MTQRLNPYAVKTPAVQAMIDLEAAVAGPKKLITRFDSSCFNGEYVTGIDDGYFERIRKLRSDDAKKSRRAS